MDDGELARYLADAAGQALQDKQLGGQENMDADALRALGDRTGQDVLSRLLTEHRPDDAVLSEEARDDPSRLRAARVWIIDPLDGTREFAELREDWAVHVALWERGSLVAGAVALPALGLVLGADEAAKRWAEPTRVRIAVSRTRPSALVLAVAERLGAELVPMGSAGFKTCAVVRGEVDAYIHTGGQFEWDSAAPVAVAVAAGLHATRIDGAPLHYNQEDPYLPDLMISNPLIAADILARVHDYPEDDAR